MSQEWSPIQNGEDASPFSYQVVAFRTNMSYFCGSNKSIFHCWSSSADETTDNKTFFGCVVPTNHLHTSSYVAALLTPESSHRYRLLGGSNIQEQANKNVAEAGKSGFLEMRTATESEIQGCREAVRSGQAVIEYNDFVFRCGLGL